MTIAKLSAALALTVLLGAAFAQNVFAQSSSEYKSPAASAQGGEPAKEIKLERFDPTLVDQTLDPCNDFYKYACNKWLTANPSSRSGLLEHGQRSRTVERGYSARDARGRQQERR
jgi:hypothetical protein